MTAMVSKHVSYRSFGILKLLVALLFAANVGHADAQYGSPKGAKSMDSLFAANAGRAKVAVESVVGAGSIESLREQGPAGLAKALEAYDNLETQIAVAEGSLTAARGLLSPVDTTPEREAAAAARQAELDQLVAQKTQLREAIDLIGGQRSCTVSRLFWHTDLAKAQAEAERTRRPILSLRMLGKLTEEYSCANSRFFRTTLYSNQSTSQFLRDNFVLHWESVRPVPRVTIDFGDGRKLERTLTGNSAHYILAADGTPLDVLPGLYGPQRFENWLVQMASFYNDTYVATAVAQRPAALQHYHEMLLRNLLSQWNTDIGRLGEAKAAAVVAHIDNALATARAMGDAVPDANLADAVPDAVKAARVAFSKTAVEAPMFRLANLGGKWMERGMDDQLWQAVAALHSDEVKLDDASVALMRAEFPNALQAGARAGGKGLVEDPILRVVRQFENSIGLDAVRNEFLLHRRVHEQFAAAADFTTSVDALNEWVYAELFLTPNNDPWLGLSPSDVYTALEGAGQTISQ